MRQRVMIAMALAQGPELLIADEPTTALDVTVQAQILDLLRDLQEESRMALLLITHDLGVAVELADQVAVMYAGRVVESGSVDRIVAGPCHPYTRGLLASSPQLTSTGDRLPTIPGLPPTPAHLPSGCAFHPRCPIAVPRCAQELPLLRPTPAGAAACHFAGEQA
jgi:oligopeptide/dipeptide ABC transporter ATP-binding protein